jgi:hypothetical protein
VGQSTPLCKERRAPLLLPAIAPEVHSGRLVVVQDDCSLRTRTVLVATRLPRIAPEIRGWMRRADTGHIGLESGIIS